MKFLTAILISAFIIPLSAHVKKTNKHSEKKHSAELNTAVITENETDKVDISEMVREQIAAARKKADEEKSTPVPHIDVPKPAKNVKSEAGLLMSIRNKIPLSDDSLIKISVLSAFSLLVFGFIMSRRLLLRKKRPKNKHDLKGLKQNIALIREERPIRVRKNNKLKTVRSRLLKKYSKVNMTNESISKTAKELKISKGELLLAERIRMHKMADGLAAKK